MGCWPICFGAVGEIGRGAFGRRLVIAGGAGVAAEEELGVFADV